jgi:hypothetical protein
MANDPTGKIWVLNRFIQLYIRTDMVKDIHWLQFSAYEKSVQNARKGLFRGFTREFSRIRFDPVTQLTGKDEENVYIFVDLP